MSCKACSRWLLLLGVFIIAMGVPTAQSLLQPPAAQALPNPCSLIPDAAARQICRTALSAGGSISPVAGLPGIPTPSLLGGIGDTLMDQAMQKFASWEADAVLGVITHVFDGTVTENKPPATDLWFLGIYAAIFAYAFLLAIGRTATRVTAAVANKDPTDGLYSITTFAAFFIFGCAFPFLTQKLLDQTYGNIAPGWIDKFAGSADATLASMKTDFAANLSLMGSPGLPILLPVVFLIVGLLSAVIVEFQMLIVAPITLLLILQVIWTAGNAVGDNNLDGLKPPLMKLLAFCCYPVILTILATMAMKMFGNAESARATLYGAVMLLLIAWLTWKAMQSLSQTNLTVSPVKKSVEMVKFYKLVTK